MRDIINVPVDKAEEFEKECKRLDTGDTTAKGSGIGRIHCKAIRLGTSGGFVGYNYAGPDWVAQRFMVRAD